VDTVKEKNAGCVKLVMEHFNLDQQPLLDSYQQGGLDQEGLIAGYQAASAHSEIFS
jgi:uncharacterized iron-regulated protein